MRAKPSGLETLTKALPKLGWGRPGDEGEQSLHVLGLKVYVMRGGNWDTPPPLPPVG